MNTNMRTFQLKSYVKYIVLKIDIFESEIIDEQNFSSDDTFSITRFKKKYSRRDDCMIVEVEM